MIQRVRKTTEATVTITQIWIVSYVFHLMLIMKKNISQPIWRTVRLLLVALTHTHTFAESTATMESSLGYTSLIQLERSHIRIETWENEGKPKLTRSREKKRTGFMWTVLSTYISWNNVFCITKTQTKANVFISIQS